MPEVDVEVFPESNSCLYCDKNLDVACGGESGSIDTMLRLRVSNIDIATLSWYTQGIIRAVFGLRSEILKRIPFDPMSTIAFKC